MFPFAVDESSVELMKDACKAAHSNATILIQGETGSGKEVLANYIHQESAFSSGPFVSVNCAALPENMIEAILFGHEKGAFTNAIATHIGKFEQAEGGTLLLDEVSEIPMILQAKLLRVLQEKRVDRIGSSKEVKIDVRIIAATNKNLKAEVESGHFRKDLFYRLNVIQLKCVSLRHRVKDIIPLANYFIKTHAKELSIEAPRLSPCAVSKLLAYRWPGNVRELENVIQRVLVMSEKETIQSDDIEFDDFNETLEDSTLANTEALTILGALKEAAGCRQSAAVKLNISPRTLRYKISKLKEIGLSIP